MNVFDQRSLRDAFGAFPTGVTVVTCLDSGKRPLGFTANSFTSVSLDPPSILVCLAKDSANYGYFTGSGGFAVNVLSEYQKDISNVFAKPVENRFASVEWNVGPHGSPILADVAAWFDCSLHQTIESGDHVILIGKVEAFDNNLTNGLGYARGSYFSSSLANQAVAAAASDADVRIGGLIERQGEVLLFTDDAGRYKWPECKLTEACNAERIQAFLARETGLSISVGQTYSVYRDRQTGEEHIVYLCQAGEGDVTAGRFQPLEDLRSLTFADSAIEDTVKRFARESSVGNFNIYFGTDLSGTVHPPQLGD